MRFFYVMTMIGSAIGGFFLWFTLSSATGAPQEAAGAAIAVAFGVLPYVFARSIEAFSTAHTNEMLREYLKQQMEQRQQSAQVTPSAGQEYMLR